MVKAWPVAAGLPLAAVRFRSVRPEARAVRSARATLSRQPPRHSREMWGGDFSRVLGAESCGELWWLISESAELWGLISKSAELWGLIELWGWG